MNEHYRWGRIEAGPVIKILKRWLEEQDEPRGHQEIKTRTDSRLGSIAQLAHWTGIKHDTLYAYTSRRKQWMDFDVADLIVCHTFGALTWHTDPDLREIYQAFDFTDLDLKRPTTLAA